LAQARSKFLFWCHALAAMPSRPGFQQYQDWDTVTVSKTAAGSRDKKDIASAARKGQVQTEQKWTSGNKDKKGVVTNSAKLDDASENLGHARVSHEFKTALQQARLAKKMSQSDLAKAINEKQSVVNEYENGKAIPNGAIVTKLNRALGARLPKAAEKKKPPTE